MHSILLLHVIVTFLSLTSAITISNLRGKTWLPTTLQGVLIPKITGVVSVVDPRGRKGFWLTSLPGEPLASIYVDCSQCGDFNPIVDHEVILTGKMTVQYDTSSEKNEIGVVIIQASRDIRSSSPTGSPKRQPVRALNLDAQLSPPTECYTRLDRTECGILECDEGSKRISRAQEPFNTARDGLDFWRSKEGSLVKLVSPISTGVSRRDFWAYSTTWPVTGKNHRGGLSVNLDDDGFVDMNPEAISIGKPLDGTQLPGVAMGTQLSDITGVLTYQEGTFRILPLTAPSITAQPKFELISAKLDGAAYDEEVGCEWISFVSYNVKGINSNQPDAIAKLASQIKQQLHLPYVILLQEVKEIDPVEGIRKTMDLLIKAIGVDYDYATIGISDNERRNSLRNIILFRRSILELIDDRQDLAVPAADVVMDDGVPILNFNPGLIKPYDPSFVNTRRPLVALFRSIGSGRLFYVVNVHFVGKRSTNLHGDIRPPNDPQITKRRQQSKVTAILCTDVGQKEFVKKILDVDPNAMIIVGGDWNEYHLTESVFQPFKDIKMEQAASLVRLEDADRYTFVHQMNSQQLDHFLVSPAVAKSGIAFEFVHMNTWAESYSAALSDHDPIQMVVSTCNEEP
ncbi:hypothetical protein FRB99_005263 [Tulasnella sp. 403]|nr:hypothetical protein FRB99_005263 [Tulasnella sp. 403]